MPVPLSHTYGKEEVAYRTTGFRIEVTRIIPVWPKKVYIQWVLRKPSSPTGYVFNIFRSGSPEGPWEQIGVDLADTYFFVDDTFTANYTERSPDLMSINRTLYYKITTVDAGQPAEIVKKMEAAPDRRRRGIHRKLQRDAMVSLKKIVGTEVAVLKRRRWGTPCTKCISSTGQSVRAHCGECHGTGITDGYWNPVYGYAQRQRKVEPIQVGAATPGKVEVHRFEIIMLNIPEVEPDDILVFLRDGKRFIVNSNIPTQIQTVCVHQELLASELARTSNEHNIPVDKWHEPEWF
jgi:hypothetical protein